MIVNNVCRLLPCCLQDPLQIDSYLRYNIFMPDINNERDDKNAAYADNLASLQRLVLFRFDEDTTGKLMQLLALLPACSTCTACMPSEAQNSIFLVLSWCQRRAS